MKLPRLLSNEKLHLSLAVGVVVLVIFLNIQAWRVYQDNQELNDTIELLAQALESNQHQLEHIQTINKDLLADLNTSRSTASSYAKEIDTNNHVITILQKLTNTDPELLKKYSKVYFLNENYSPAELTTILPALIYNHSPLQLRKDVLPFLTHMLNDAAASSTPLQIVSSYRSFGTQAALKSSYKVTYGAGTANQFSADQGYSEHQLGTTVDVTASSSVPFNNFDKTPQFEWLALHAHEYGFTLSYPKSNKYYQYEPWHWRFVGIALATRLYVDHQYFYDLTQREIDEYLVHLFDYAETQ